MHYLKEWRTMKQWTQSELGEKLGTDKHQISRWEHGHYRPCRMARVQLRRLGFERWAKDQDDWKETENA